MRFVAALLLALPSGGAELPLSPDLDAAALAAVREIRSLLFAAPEGRAGGWALREGEGREADGEVRRALVAALAAEGVHVETGERDGSVALEVDHLRLDGREALALRAVRPAAGAVFAPFVRKPWVLRSPAPPTGGWALRGESELEGSEEDARARAIGAAAAALRARLAGLGLPERTLRRSLPDDAVGRRFVVDTFTLREADLWRGFALVRVDSDAIDRLASDASDARARERSSARAAVLSLAGIAAGCFFVYVWLDFATAGRRSVPLRLLALGLFGACAGLAL